MSQNTASRATLVLAGTPHPVERAELSIGRPVHWPRRADAEVGLCFLLELHLGHESGEDGAAAPMIQYLPVREAFGRWPRLDELAGLVVAVERDELWDAWYGNDGPSLGSNRLVFGSWSGSAIATTWSASWDRGREAPGTLVFEGEVSLGGITLHIVEDEAVESLISSIWGIDALTRFDVSRLPPPPQYGEPLQRPREMPKTVSYSLWPRFLGPEIAAPASRGA